MRRLVFSTLLLALGLFALARLIAPPARDLAGEPPPRIPTINEQPASFGDETVIRRDASGRFRLPARVNGEDTEFLVDTGADVVALTEAEADRLGLTIAPDDFRPILKTASGTGEGARVRLDRLELGDDEFRDVDAVVVRGLAENLLGRSVLARFGKVEMQGDRMVIQHR